MLSEVFFLYEIMRPKKEQKKLKDKKEKKSKKEETKRDSFKFKFTKENCKRNRRTGIKQFPKMVKPSTKQTNETEFSWYELECVECRVSSFRFQRRKTFGIFSHH